MNRLTGCGIRNLAASVLLTAVLTLGSGCVAMSGGSPSSWKLGYDATESLTIGGFWANYFTVYGSGDVLAAYTVERGTADIYLMTFDQYLHIKEEGPSYEWMHSVPRQLTTGSQSGEVFASVSGGKWAVVYFNAAESQDAGEDKSVRIHSQIYYRTPSVASGGPSVEYRPGGMCPSCLSATCHRVHPMCSKCQGRGIAWSEIMKADITCNFCHGTGRSDY